MESIQMFIIFGVGIYFAYIVYSTPSPMPEKIGGMIGGFFSGCGLGAIIAAIVSAFIPS